MQAETTLRGLLSPRQGGGQAWAHWACGDRHPHPAHPPRPRATIRSQDLQGAACPGGREPSLPAARCHPDRLGLLPEPRGGLTDAAGSGLAAQGGADRRSSSGGGGRAPLKLRGSHVWEEGFVRASPRPARQLAPIWGPPPWAGRLRPLHLSPRDCPARSPAGPPSSGAVGHPGLPVRAHAAADVPAGLPARTGRGLSPEPAGPAPVTPLPTHPNACRGGGSSPNT